MRRSLVAKLEDLGACAQALDWVEAQRGAKPSIMWKDPDLEPPYMLWLLRRTCTSYRSKKLRVLAACLIELVNAATAWRVLDLYEEKAREQIQLFADDLIDANNLNVWFCQHKYTDLGSFYEVICTLSKYWDGRPTAVDIEQRADLLSVSISLPNWSVAREIIIRHFPKPPRLA